MADKSIYIADLKRDLRQLETEIARARRVLNSGSLREKPHAASELATLEREHKELEHRLAEAEKHDAKDWSATHSGLREQLDAVGDALERWIGSYTGGRR